VVSVTNRLLCPGRNFSRDALQLLATRNNVKDLDIFGRKLEKFGMNETGCENTDRIQLAQVKGCYEEGNEAEFYSESWLNEVVGRDQQRHVSEN